MVRALDGDSTMTSLVPPPLPGAPLLAPVLRAAFGGALAAPAAVSA